jgi:hypothetical protein
MSTNGIMTTATALVVFCAMAWAIAQTADPRSPPSLKKMTVPEPPFTTLLPRSGRDRPGQSTILRYEGTRR